MGVSHREIYTVYTIFEGKSHTTVIHSNCYNDPDPSTLGNIDPDIHYFRDNSLLKNTKYFNDKTFKQNLKKIINSRCTI